MTGRGPLTESEPAGGFTEPRPVAPNGRRKGHKLALPPVILPQGPCPGHTSPIPAAAVKLAAMRTSGQVTPDLAPPYLLDRCHGDAEFRCQDSAGFLRPAEDGADLLLRQSGHRVSLAGHGRRDVTAVTSLAERVAVVVPLGAEEEVCRVDAAGIVPAGAVVTDLEPGRDGAVGENPGKAVRPDGSSSGWKEHSVPELHLAALPQPAFVRSALEDFLPEAFFCRTPIAVTADCRTGPGATAVSVSVGRRGHGEGFAADRAGERDRMTAHQEVSFLGAGGGSVTRRRPQFVTASFYGKGV